MPRAAASALLRMRTLVALVLATGAFGLESACGNSDKATACVPGQSVACVGDQACDTSFQVCRDDGSGYGECLCSKGGVTFQRTGPSSGLIGAACESDAYCRKGLNCVTKSSTEIGGEGPSGGLCLAPCPPGNDAFCAGVDATAKCVTLDDQATPSTDDDVVYCMPGCKIGDTKDPDKCRSRPDSVCTEDKLGSGVGYCRPACRNDVDCAPRRCDIATGLCGDAAPAGDPIGAACIPDNPSCAGGCFPGAGGYAECSGVCSYGEPGGCGQANTSPPYDYFCYIDAAFRAGAGDLGYCARACDCDNDCGRTDAVCEPTTQEIAQKTGRAGICGSKMFANGTARKNTPCK